MKNITFVCPSLAGGGAERVMLILAEKFRSVGIEVCIVLLYKERIYYKYSRGIRIIQLQKLSIFELYKVLKKLNSQLYISFLPAANLYLLIVNIFLRKKVIITERSYPDIAFKTLGNPFYKKPYLEFMHKTLANTATGMVFQSKNQQGYYSKRVCSKAAIIPNPLKDDIPESFEGEKRREFVAVGSLKHAKNYPTLLRAFAKVREKYPDYKLSIYGKGNLKNQLVVLASKCGIREYVEFKGFSRNVHEEIKDSFAYVLSSEYEGMPNALIEAMALGLPVISTNFGNGAGAEMVSNNVNGLLVPPCDENRLAEAMIRIIEDDELRNKISKNALKARELYNADKVFLQWKGYIEKIVDGGVK